MSAESVKHVSGVEKALIFGRNLNAVMAVGGAALALAIPGSQPLLAAYNLWNGAQAVGFEAARRWQHNKHQEKLGQLALTR